MAQQIQEPAQSRALEIKRKSFTTLRNLLDQSKSQLQAALPKHMTAERLIRVALTTYQKTPELANCDAMSILQAVMESAQLGLEPDGLLGHAYLIPYKGKAKLIPGYKGYIALGYRSGEVSLIAAEIVYEKDHMVLELGTDRRLEHKPNLDIADRGKPRLVYAICKMKDGSVQFVWMTLFDIEKHRKCSAAPNSPAWKDNWDAMAKKTAVRELAKWIPQCPEMQRAAAKDEAVDLGIDLGDDGAIDITDDDPPTVEIKTKSEDVADRIANAQKPAAQQQGGDDVATARALIVKLEAVAPGEGGRLFAVTCGDQVTLDEAPIEKVRELIVALESQIRAKAKATNKANGAGQGESV